MPAFKLAEFSGIAPKLGATELGDNQAQIARNIRLQSKEMRTWKGATLAYTPTTNNVKTVFRFAGPPEITPIWLEFASDVDVAVGPVADTGEYRLYFTSDGFAPRKTNYNMASGNNAGVAPYPNAWYELGVPAPTGAPSLAVTQGEASVAETRSYVYTHVTEFGIVAEESAPSPATLIEANYSGSSVTVSGFSVPPTGNYNFKYRRIYRSVVGSNSLTFQLVAEIPIAQSSYVDTKEATALGIVMSSLYFTPPPAGLRGLVSMPNGMMAGFVGNQIWFCEPYLPHAWPETYTLTTEYPIVGLGVMGNSLFVGTTQNPYLIAGGTPLSMAQEKLPMVQPCVSKRSIVSDQYGLLYASPNGLVTIGQGAQDVATKALYTREEWQLLNPASMVGALYNNMYFGFYNVGASYDSIVIQRDDNPPLSNFTASARGTFVDQATGTLYIIATDNKVYALDSNVANPAIFQWKSKKFTMPKPTNFASVHVHADFAQMIGGRYVTVKTYADGVVVSTHNPTSARPYRLPAGFMAYEWEIEVTGNVPVRSIGIATSNREMAGF